MDSYSPNGTCEDVLSFLARAEARRRGIAGRKMPFKPPIARFFIEPVFNLAGLGVRAAAALLPARRALAVQDRMFAMVAGKSGLPFEADAPGLLEARRLSNRAREEGKPCALLCVASHPPVEEGLLNLNVEMTRQIFLALELVRGSPCRPRMVIAIDPYGLDMLGLAAEAAYAGFVGTYHLGIDRLALRRGMASRLLLGRLGWQGFSWRFLKVLSAAGEAGIVLAGGVAQTARTLYAAREFMIRLREASSRRRAPGEALDALKRSREDLRLFIETEMRGVRSPSAWRLMEAWIAARLVGEWGTPGEAAAPGTADAYTGVLSAGTKEALRAYTRALDCPEAFFEKEEAAFEEELGRETPYRARLFRLLSARLAKRGIPVLLIPLSHRVGAGGASGGRAALSWGRPVFLPAFETEEEARRFSVGFGRENFS